MIESEAMTIISQVGFPIFVAIYVLFRMEKTINKNTEAIKSVLALVNKKF